jgi:hypothetical protein
LFPMVPPPFSSVFIRSFLKYDSIYHKIYKSVYNNSEIKGQLAHLHFSESQ